MQRQFLTLLIFAALSTAAFANDEHHPEGDKKPAAAKAVEPAKAPPAVTTAKQPVAPSPTDKQFNSARDQMKKMLAQMDKIRQTKDPIERQRLMQEHMQTMRDGAQAMRGTGSGMMMDMMDCPMMADKGDKGDKADKGSMQACSVMGAQSGKMDMGKRVDTVEKRMDMMQMMMEQMVERESQKSSPP